MPNMKAPNRFRLSEFADKTAHYYRQDIYVRCHYCDTRITPQTRIQLFHYCKNCKIIYYSGVPEVIIFAPHFGWRVRGEVLRAKRKNLPATLTPRQWLFCLEFFEFSCAYCGEPWERFEHIIPISKGGGTTVHNCLPACKSCNYKKGLRTYFPDLPEQFAARIEEYFSLPSLDNPPFRFNPLKHIEDLDPLYDRPATPRMLLLGHRFKLEDLPDDNMFL